ncbi:MAG: hypothetical protein ACREQF_10630 [Candidatus Binataceae bacterium]
MPLSDAQIERYSRQIVVPGFGGKAQQRLRAAELVVIGQYDELVMPLRYLVGAGVGHIHVDSGSVGARAGELVEQTGALNPDVSIDIGASAEAALVLALVCDEASRDSLAARKSDGTFVIARLDAPAMIAIIPLRPPCPACSDAKLLRPFGRRVAESRFIAMLAVTEALKLAAGVNDSQTGRVVEFHGYEAESRALGISTAGHCSSKPRPRPGSGRER